MVELLFGLKVSQNIIPDGSLCTNTEDPLISSFLVPGVTWPDLWCLCCSPWWRLNSPHCKTSTIIDQSYLRARGPQRTTEDLSPHLMSDPDTLLSLLGPVLGEVCLVLDLGPGLGPGGGLGLTDGETLENTILMVDWASSLE